MEASRDYSDNDGVPWRVEVFIGLGLLILVGGVAVLVVLFEAIQRATGR